MLLKYKTEEVSKLLIFNDFNDLQLENKLPISFTFEVLKLLTSIDLNLFDISKVYDISYMFSECVSLSYINLESFNTSRVNLFWGLFNNLSDYGQIVYNSEKFNLDIINEISENWTKVDINGIKI